MKKCLRLALLAVSIGALLPASALAAGQKNYAPPAGPPSPYRSQDDVWWEAVGFDLSMDVGVASVNASSWSFGWDAQQNAAATRAFGQSALPGRSLGLRREMFVGTTYRLFPSLILWRWLDVALEWGVLGGTSDSVAGGALPAGAAGGALVPTTARAGLLFQYGLRAGVVVPAGPLLLRGTALFGGETAPTDVYYGSPATRVSTSASAGVIAPRAAVDLRVTGPLYVGAYASLDVLHPGDWQGGLAVTVTSGAEGHY